MNTKDIGWPAVAALAICVLGIVGLVRTLLVHVGFDRLIALDPEVVVWLVGAIAGAVGAAWARSISKKHDTTQTIKVASGGSVTVEPAPVAAPADRDSVHVGASFSDAERTPTEPHTTPVERPRGRRPTRLGGFVDVALLAELCLGVALALAGVVAVHWSVQ